MIGRLLTVPWTICDRAELAEKVAAMDTDVVVSFGAGNIDACCGHWQKNCGKKPDSPSAGDDLFFSRPCPSRPYRGGK